MPGLVTASRMFPTCGTLKSSGTREHPRSSSGVHVFRTSRTTENVDGRDKPGHDRVARRRKHRESVADPQLGHLSGATATSAGVTSTGKPFCHCTMKAGALAFWPFGSNLISL